MVIQQNFNKFYEQIYGERWDHLSMALLQESRQVQRHNPFAHEGFHRDTPGASTLDEVVPLQEGSHELQLPPLCEWSRNRDEIPRGVNQLLSYYVLDPASVIVAENLGVKPGEKVLDLCAAPGGKSLVLAQALFQRIDSDSELILNELSFDRRERLKKVVQQYISKDFRSQVWVRGKDGSRFGLDVQNYFDAVLVDAPCSGERHLILNAKMMEAWSERRSKLLAQKQYSLLCSAWLALKQGGRLMYSTCSLSPFENDGVIDKFLSKKKDAALGTMSYQLKNAEVTQYGQIYLPDRCHFGPMYSCLLIKSP